MILRYITDNTIFHPSLIQFVFFFFFVKFQSIVIHVTKQRETWNLIIFCSAVAFLHFLQQFDRCFIGSSPDQELDSMFCGQISSVYGFSDALSPQQIQAISALGPGYKVSPFEIVLFFRINVEDWKCLFEILVFFAFARQTAVFIEFEKYYSLSMWQLPVKSTPSQNYFFSYFFKLCKFSLH